MIRAPGEGAPGEGRTALRASAPVPRRPCRPERLAEIIANEGTMAIADRIRDLRGKSGRTERELADALGLTIEGYRDLEQYDDELETTISIAQAVILARLLGTNLLEMIGESAASTQIQISAIRAGMVAELGRSPGAREELEDLIDWDLGPFLEGADQWMTVYTLDFIKSLSTAIGLNYGEVLPGLN
jgi:transcriptional regulator with XRE-family HTH domain